MLLGLTFKTKTILKWESRSVRNYQNILTVPKFYFHKSFQVKIFVKANPFPQTVSITVNQYVQSLKTLLPTWHKGSHLTRPLLQEPITLHPPGSCHCSKSAGFGFYPSLTDNILLPSVVLSTSLTSLLKSALSPAKRQKITGRAQGKRNTAPASISSYLPLG